MAHERKANESTSPVAKGQRSPIPAGKKDDLEDVSWALSTAEAMWGRGDHADGLKWLRRAAEAAAEAEADDRALELAKAAADVASLLAENRVAESRATEARAAEARAIEHRAPTPPPPTVVPAVTASPIITTPSNPPPPPPFRQVGGAPSPQRVSPMVSPYPRPGQKSPTPPRVAQPAPISKRGGRKSSPGIDEANAQTRSNRVSTTNEAKKRNRASKPSPDETSPVTMPIPSVTATAPFPAMNEQNPAWQAQQLANHDLDDDDDDQYTRIGTPAYTESAQKASARPPPIAAGAPPPIPSPKPQPQPAPAPPVGLKSSQAVRVVVWRAADGVHVAPAGTTVAAISVEAFLVAIDPTADLTAWLTNK